MPVRTLKFSLWVSCPLLLALCLLPQPACKKPTEPKAALPDTTSHDFVFEIDTLGNGSSSVLNDVCIIDENNIWAVGEIYVQDASGQSEEFYNAVHWNGSLWELKKITVNFRGNSVVPPLEGAFAFSAAEVWFASSVPIKWNGSFATLYHLYDMGILTPDDGSVSKLWGSNSRNLYFVGRKGTIVYYDGSTWQKLASGTTVDIQDIWGEGQTVLAVASLVNYERGLDLLKIDGTTVTKLDTTGLRIAESSVWFAPGKVYYVAGDGLFQKSGLTEQRWQFSAFQPSIYIDRIRANASNDIFVCGSFGFMAHYNGSAWKDYTGSEVPRFFSRYKGLSVKHDLVVAVGWMNDQAIIVRGKRR